MSLDSNASVESEPEVYFVYTNVEISSQKIFDESLKACQEAGIDPKKLSDKECLSLTPSNTNDIYILDSFDSDVYEHLVAHNARVRGAPCVLHCLKSSEDLPDSDHPVYSMCLKGSLITLTGVAAAQRGEVVKKIQWLGGTFTKGLVKSTSHLVAQEVSSKKYQAAIGLGIPVLTLDWLTDSYEKSKTVLFDAKEPAYMRKYNCPVFLGCVITSSNLEDKNKIKDIVEKGGGTYSGQMAYKQCTHLVIKIPQGEKYNMAKKWGSVHIVTPLWVYDCEKVGYKVSEEESKYSVSKGASTPENEHFPLPQLADISAIQATTFCTSRVDETMQSVSRGRGNSTDMTTLASRSPRTSDSTLTRSTDISPDLNIAKSDVLLNCKVCIRGFDDKVSASLTSVVTICGGLRSFSTVNADYIVISTLDGDTLEHVKTLSQPVVSSEWLKKVSQTQTLVEVSPYLLYKPNKRRRSSTGEDHPHSKRRTTLSSTESAAADQSMLDTELANGSNEELLSQYGGAPPVVNENGGATRTASPEQVSLIDQPMTPDTTLQATLRNGTPAITPYLTRPQPELTAPFKNMRFHLHKEISRNEIYSIQLMIRAHGGVIIDSEDGASSFHSVMPVIIQHRLKNSSNRMVVSTVWVRACDRLCKFLPIDSNPLFVPTMCANSTAFSDCVVTTTGLSAHEREAISSLVTHSGGRYVEDLRKFAGSGIPATTHLVCESTESAKYKAAKNWGISITKISWITDSVSSGLLQPINTYQPLTSEDVAVESSLKTERRTLASLQTPIHTRVQALRLGSTGSSAKKPPPTNGQYLSTSILDNPDKSFHMELDMDCFDTPKPKETVKNGVDTPLDQALDHYLTLACNKHYVKTPNGVGSSDSPSCSGILSGTVICVSKKLSAQSEDVRSVVTSLGGQYQQAYDSTVTHLIFQGKASEGEYRAAKRNNQFIICPLWLEKCKEEGKRVTESLYPHNYKVDKALGLQGTPTRKSGRISRVPLEFGTDSPSSAEGSVGSSGPDLLLEKVKTEEVEDEQDIAETLLVLQQIRSYMKKRLVVPKKFKTSTKVSVNSTSPAADITSSDSTDHSKIRDTANVSPSAETQSQGDAIVTWDDQISRFEQEMLDNAASSGLDSEVLAEMEEDFTQERVPMAATRSQDLSADYTTTTTVHENMETSIHAPRRVFQFSGFGEEERDEMAERLRTLGVETLVASNFDLDCTHIILNKPQRNEKFLCALVRGLWLLDKSYIKACVEARQLLQEEEYEWGNPKAVHMDWSNLGIAPYANASYRRRVNIQAGNGRDPFSDWKVVLALAKDKQDSMRRILEIGKAEIIACSFSQLPEEGQLATHAFIDTRKKSGLLAADIQKLQDSGVRCLKAEYIPSYLVNDSNFDDSKYDIAPASISTRSASASSVSAGQKGSR